MSARPFATAQVRRSKNSGETGMIGVSTLVSALSAWASATVFVGREQGWYVVGATVDQVSEYLSALLGFMGRAPTRSFTVSSSWK